MNHKSSMCGKEVTAKTLISRPNINAQTFFNNLKLSKRKYTAVVEDYIQPGISAQRRATILEINIYKRLNLISIDRLIYKHREYDNLDIRRFASLFGFEKCQRDISLDGQFVLRYISPPLAGEPTPHESPYIQQSRVREDSISMRIKTLLYKIGLL